MSQEKKEVAQSYDLSSSDFSHSSDEENHFSPLKSPEPSPAKVTPKVQDITACAKILAKVIGYLRADEIAAKVFTLSRGVRQFFAKQNYRLFGIFLRAFQLSRRNKRTDFVAKHDVFRLFRFCAQAIARHQAGKRSAEVLFKDAIES